MYHTFFAIKSMSSSLSDQRAEYVDYIVSEIMIASEVFGV